MSGDRSDDARDAGGAGEPADRGGETPDDGTSRDRGDGPPDSAVGAGLFEEGMGPTSAAAHLYRGEMGRMRFWRQRLDRTTYWAIVIMSVILTWTFSSRDNPHYILLLGATAVVAFLAIEARRYRGYDIWRGRVRSLQRNVFAHGLDPDGDGPDPGWRERLAEDYRRPAIKISAEEAIAHRLRRVYLLLFSILLGAWAIRVLAFANRPWPESAAIGRIPGLAVTAVVAGTYLLALVVALRPRTWQAADELHETDVGRNR